MSEHVAHTETYKGLTLKIILDEHGGTDSPVEDGANAVIFAVLHRHYINPADKFILAKPEGSEEAFYDFESPEGIAEFEKDIADAGDKAEWVVFPLFMYDHSGTVYKASEGGNPFNCQWDSGRVGIIALKKSEFGEPGHDYGNGQIAKPYIDQANSVCENFTEWANGEIYGYVVEDETGETLDSCWGYIGTHDSYVLEEGRRVLKAMGDEHEPVANIKLERNQAIFALREFSDPAAYSPEDQTRLKAVTAALVEAFPGIDEMENED